MNISEIVSHPDFQSGEKWAQPINLVSWKGLGLSTTTKGRKGGIEYLVVVPFSTGRPWCPTVRELQADWILRTPGEILDQDEDRAVT